MFYKVISFPFIFILFIVSISNAQSIKKVFFIDSINIYTTIDTSYFNKTIPLKFKEAIHVALQYYPELSKTKIVFKVKKTISPLSARPTFLSILKKPANRKYIVTISKSTIKKLESILLNNLSYNAQVGVLGHELGHIYFYNTKSGIYFVALVFKHLNKKAIDKFEYNTDLACIKHGLGFQLLS